MMKAAIFDMDGVLIDSISTAHRVRTKVLRQYGLELQDIPDPHNEGHKGTSLANLVKAVKDHHGIDIDFEELKNQVSPMIQEDLKNNNVVVDPQLVDFLHELKDHGVLLAVATSSVKRSADDKLEILGIGDLFDVVVTADDVKDHKPHPASYLAAIKELDIAPTQAIVFEDSHTGVAAGLAAGATVVGVSIHNPDKSALSGVAKMIDNWNEVSYRDISELLSRSI